MRCCTRPRSRSPRPSATGPGKPDVQDSRLRAAPPTRRARRCASPPRSPAPPPCARACRNEHECSVAELAELVGRELGLPESLQGDLRLAGLLHDVGTIAVAGAVLSKPGPLDEDEWVHAARAPEHRRRHGRAHPRARTHAARDPPPPRALRRRRATPTGSRASPSRWPRACWRPSDAYTAMTEIRPYRDARDRAEALEELRRNAGTQLDPPWSTRSAACSPARTPAPSRPRPGRGLDAGSRLVRRQPGELPSGDAGHAVATRHVTFVEGRAGAGASLAVATGRVLDARALRQVDLHDAA